MLLVDIAQQPPGLARRILNNSETRPHRPRRPGDRDSSLLFHEALNLFIAGNV